MTETLREIDLSGFATGDLSNRRRIATAIAAELRRLGFFVITGHGVPADLIDRTFGTATAFFDRPLDDKLRIRSRVQGSPRGYLDFGLETLALSAGVRTPPDLKEGFGLGPLGVRAERDVLGGSATYTPNVWPDAPADFQAIVTEYYRQMERLMDVLMELFAIGMDLPPRFFVDRFADHNSTLRLNHYPAQDRPAEPGQLRAGAHTDYGALTILLGQDRLGGLQVRTPDGGWIDARTNPHSFVINIGDLMMRWSNDTWLSNQHRVVNPPPHAGPSARRLSFAYFCNPNDDLLIECLPTCQSAERPAKYGPIRAGAHRFAKIEASKKAAAC